MGRLLPFKACTYPNPSGRRLIAASGNVAVSKMDFAMKDSRQSETDFPQIAARLNNRRFSVASNTQGLSGAGTVFHYSVDDGAINSTYQGGRIRTGNQVGRVTGPDTIELLFQCLTTEGELLAGWSRGTVGVDQAGRTTLHFVWGWLSGATGGGESNYVELID